MRYNKHHVLDSISHQLTYHQENIYAFEDLRVRTANQLLLLLRIVHKFSIIERKYKAIE